MNSISLHAYTPVCHLLGFPVFLRGVLGPALGQSPRHDCKVAGLESKKVLLGPPKVAAPGGKLELKGQEDTSAGHRWQLLRVGCRVEPEPGEKGV